MRIDPSLSCVGLPAIDLLTASTPAPGPAIATPVVSTAASLAGDTRPTYSIDFSEPRPAGGGIGDTLEARWGTSLSAMTAMTPESVTITEGMFVDGDDPFPELGDFAGLQSLGTTIYFSFRVVRGADLSDWSNTGTLLLVDGTMDAPVLTDLTGQATDARVWSALFSVAGLASGAWARLEGTGPIRVGGTTVYEAGTQVQVQNGASVEFGIDTSASAGTAVDNVVSNRGVTLETFSATTAGTAFAVDTVVIEGDSNSVGSLAYGAHYDSSRPDLTTTVTAQGGRQIGTTSNLNDAGNTLMGQVSADLALNPNLVTAQIGTNDLGGISAATYRSRMGDYAGAITAGAARLAWAMPPPYNPADTAGNYATYMANWNSLASTARDPSVWGAFADYFIPLGLHPDLHNVSLAATVWKDQLHFSDWVGDGSSGQERVLETYAAGVNTIADATRATSTVPYESVWPDAETNLPLSTQITRRVVISGIAHEGIAGGVSITGGDAAVSLNGSAFAANTTGASTWLYNGDVVDLRLTTSAANSTAVAVDLTIGTETRAIDFTTIGASPVTLVDGTSRYRDHGFAANNYNFGTNSDALSFPAVGMGVVILASNSRKITAVTIGGVAATRVVSVAESLGLTNQDLSIWEAPIASASDENVAVTCSGTIWRLVAHSFVLESAAAGTLQGTPKTDSSAATHSVGEIAVLADGLGIFAAYDDQSGGNGDLVFIGATEFLEYFSAGNQNLGAASFATTATPSVAMGASTSNLMVVGASWARAQGG